MISMIDVNSDDSKLIEDYISGEDDKFDILIEKYSKPVWRYVFRMIKDSEETNDIVQTVFVKAWKNIRKFSPERSFRAWIFSIAHNTSVDWLRKRRALSFSSLDDEENIFEESIADTSPLPDVILENKLFKEKIDDALNMLSLNEKTVVILHALEDMTFSEISEILDKPINTVKSKFLRAIEKMKRFIRE